MSSYRHAWVLVAAAVAVGCSSSSVDPAGLADPATDSAELATKPPPTKPPPPPLCGPGGCPTFCAVATVSGPSYYARNFASYADAKAWLATLAAKDSLIDSGPCAKPTACPLLYTPICGEVSGAEAATFGNGCELLVATRAAAGGAPPGEAKGVLLHDGACAPPAADACAGQKCGAPCPSMFGSPVPTYCDATGACRPGKPVCDGPYDCDLSTVKCDAPEPACPPGMTPSVVGVCYGPCVPLTACEGYASKPPPAQ